MEIISGRKVRVDGFLLNVCISCLTPPSLVKIGSRGETEEKDRRNTRSDEVESLASW